MRLEEQQGNIVFACRVNSQYNAAELGSFLGGIWQ
jgi:hypothetical protein